MMKKKIQFAGIGEEEQSWKCKRHYSVQSNGVCHICLRDRLLLLCPNCASLKPCDCFESAYKSSSSSTPSSSTSFCIFSDELLQSSDETGSVGRIGTLIENEPAFRRSRTTVCRSSYGVVEVQPSITRSGSLLRSVMRRETKNQNVLFGQKEQTAKLPRSKSVGMSRNSNSGKDSGKTIKFNEWIQFFHNPLRFLSKSKTAKIVNKS